MMKRSSSETISRGVKKEDSFSSLTTFAGSAMARSAAARQALDGDVLVGVDADGAGNLHGFDRDRLGAIAVYLDDLTRRRHSEGDTGPDTDEHLLRLQYADVARQHTPRNSVRYPPP